MADYILPKDYAHVLEVMRPSLTRALMIAVESGDAATAASLFRAVAGPEAASHLAPREVLETVGAWLSSECAYATEVRAA